MYDFSYYGELGQPIRLSDISLSTCRAPILLVLPLQQKADCGLITWRLHPLAFLVSSSKCFSPLVCFIYRKVKTLRIERNVFFILKIISFFCCSPSRQVFFSLLIPVSIKGTSDHCYQAHSMW